MSDLPSLSDLDTDVNTVVWCADRDGEYSEDSSAIAVAVVAHPDMHCAGIAYALRQAADKLCKADHPLAGQLK